MIQVIDSNTGTADSDEMEQITAFNNRLRAEGKFLMAAGLQSPENSTVFDNRNNIGNVSPGPLIVQAEYVSGFWIIEVEDLDGAKEIAKEASLVCNRKVELRPFIQ